MLILRRLREARAARERVHAARVRLGDSILACQARLYAQPLRHLALVAGAGWAFGRLARRPWRILEIANLVSSRAWPWFARVLAMARRASVQ